MRRFVLGTVLLLVLASCSASGDSASGYEMTEYSIAGPDSLPSGPASLPITNTGQFDHTLVVTDEIGEVMVATGLVKPGETVLIDLDLDRGHYTFTCRIVVETGEGVLLDHYQQGMTTRVEAK